MKKYIMPKLEFVELKIAENIAALVPKTIYKSNGSTGGMTADSEVGYTEEKEFGETSIL